MKVTIEQSPYGDTGKTYEGLLGMINHYILQLENFRPQHVNSPDRLAHLERDIAGYKELLKTDEDTVNRFMKAKHEWTDTLRRFKDNLEIVEHMKANGEWPVAHELADRSDEGLP